MTLVDHNVLFDEKLYGRGSCDKMDKSFVKNWGFSVSNDDQMCVYSHKNSSEWHRKNIWHIGETQGIDIYRDTIDFLNLSDVIIPIFLF